MPDDYTFFDLHAALQDAFGWEDAHLHQFFTSSPFKRERNYQQIALPSPEMEDVLDEREEKLFRWFKNSKSVVWYEYDFGDSWMHEIQLEKKLPQESNKKYPFLLDGARACPPEDCGGLGAYCDLIRIITDQKSPEHADMLEWLGIDNPKDFDPAAFDPSKVKFQNPRQRLKEYERGYGI